MKFQYNLAAICQIAVAAGRHISTVYHAKQATAVEHKADGSPVTLADTQADALICQQLSAMTPHIPVISEESVAKVAFAKRQAWQTYWLVDPLDGTKEFIAGTGEFSVNIALIKNHQPVLGVVYGPETGQLYFGVKSLGSQPQRCGQIAITAQHFNLNLQQWAQCLQHSERLQLRAHPNVLTTHKQAIKVAVSRRHGGALQRFMSELGAVEKIKMGSALKSCLVASGQADIYPRFGPTSLWDTAASQCILEVTGGAILNAAGHPLAYVQTESLLNPFFIAVAHPNYAWPQFPEIF